MARMKNRYIQILLCLIMLRICEIEISYSSLLAVA